MSIIETLTELVKQQSNLEVEEYPASDYINEQYARNDVICIYALYSVFKADNYKLAKDVVNAIRFSDIPYLTDWFKHFLLDGMKIESCGEFMSEVYNLYHGELSEIN